MTKTYWYCNDCGSYNVHSIEGARFDPNNNFEFIEATDMHIMDFCNNCNSETVFDEATNEEYLKYVNDMKTQERMNLFMKEPNND